jgi:hypothetical protein
MAIIVLQHTVADNFDVDPNWTVTSDGPVYAGSLVGLDSNSYVKLAGVNDALGIAGDSIADEYKTGAYSAELVISPSGKKRWTQNRIDNYFDETAASGKMTVYTTGGRFGTDQFVTGLTYTPGTAVYSNGSGLFTSSVTTRKVGYVLVVPGDYPSGVPGADAPSADLSMSLGDYLFVQLSI